ncbi:Cloroperoxidase [Apiospora arundinis]
MNALANHGYLPHDGRDIERDTLLDALEEAVNFDRPCPTSSSREPWRPCRSPMRPGSRCTTSLSTMPSSMMVASGTKSSDYPTSQIILEALSPWSTTNVASPLTIALYSRPDTFFSTHQDVFDPTVFAEARSYWPDPVITLRQAAAARLARVRTANRTNPAFELSKFGTTVSLTEQAIYMVALGDVAAGTVRREYVEYFFVMRGRKRATAI